MPSSGNEEARVPIKIPVETNAGEAATSVEHLTDAITKSKDAIALAAQNMRNLRGKSDAVKAAKDQLSATIRAEEDAVTKSTLKLLKHGTSYDRVAEQTKKYGKQQDEARKKAEAFAKETAKKRADFIKKSDEERTKAFSSAISHAGGPVARLRDTIKELGEIAGHGGGLGVLTLAAAGATVAVIALTAAIVAGVGALARWVLKGADAARSMQLVREASANSVLSATNLGTQVDALAQKVPTATAELNQLAASLARSRLGGQATVDTLNAVAQASAAIDEGTGAKIQDIITRGKLVQRMYLGLRELEGTGLDFTDVAASLAKNMKIGIKDAQRALLEGRVSLSDGAKAMRDAVEKKFGDINLRKMMSLEGLTDTLHKKLAAMTNGVNLEPAARAAFKFLQVFDESTATGAVLKRAVTAFGNGVVNVIERGAPIAKDFVRSMIVGGLKMYITYLEVKNAFKKAFGKDVVGDFDAVGASLKVVSFWADNLKTILVAAAFTTGLLVAGFALVATAVDRYVIKPISDIKSWVDSIDWAATGSAIVDGIIKGLKGTGAGKLVDAVKWLGELAHKAFTGKLEIKSPSKLFERSSKHIPEGSAKGIEKGAPQVERAVKDMAPAPPAGGGAAFASRAPVTITVEATIILAGGGGAASSPSQQLSDPGLFAQTTKLFKDAARAAGYSLAEEG